MGIHRGVYQRQYVDGGIVDDRNGLAIHPTKSLELESFVDKDDHEKLAFKAHFNSTMLVIKMAETWFGRLSSVWGIGRAPLSLDGTVDVQLTGTYTNFHTTNAPFSLDCELLPGSHVKCHPCFTEQFKSERLWWTAFHQFRYRITRRV
jgi:hypothetical protein